MTYTYSALIIGAIRSYLENKKFKTDEAHWTGMGSRLQMEDPSGQKYEILVQPIYEKKRAALPLNGQRRHDNGVTSDQTGS